MSSICACASDRGCCIRIKGRGTMAHSQAAHGFAVRAIEAGAPAVTFDLSACDYLDSTFLGCLIDLHQQFSRSITIAASADDIRRLFGPTQLDKLLHCVSSPPDCYGDPVPLADDDKNRGDLAAHVTLCHRRLAEIDGPMQPVFARLAAQLEREQAH